MRTWLRNKMIWMFVMVQGFLLASTDAHAEHSKISDAAKSWVTEIASLGPVVKIGFGLIGLVLFGWGWVIIGSSSKSEQKGGGKLQGFAFVGIGTVLMAISYMVKMTSGSIVDSDGSKSLGELGID